MCQFQKMLPLGEWKDVKMARKTSFNYTVKVYIKTLINKYICVFCVYLYVYRNTQNACIFKKNELSIYLYLYIM